MKWVNIGYGLVFFIASIIYAIVLNYFVGLSLVLGSFLSTFGICSFLLIGTIIMTNTYIEDLSYEYLDYVAFTYIGMGILILYITKTSFVFTSMCSVIAIYYVVKSLKHNK